MKGSIKVAIVLIITIIIGIVVYKNMPVPEEQEIHKLPPIKRKAMPKLEITNTLPEEANVVAMAPTTRQLFKTFQIEGNKILGFDLPEEIQEVQELLGANIFTEKGLEQIGINIDKEIGFFSTGMELKEDGKDIDISMTMFLPVTDEKTLQETIDKLQLSEGMSKTQKEGYTLYSTEDFTLAIAPKPERYYISVGSSDKKVSEEMEQLLRGKRKLSSSKKYNKALKGLGNEGTFFCYFDLNDFISDKTFEMISKGIDSLTAETDLTYDPMAFLHNLRAYKGLAFWLDINGKDLIVRLTSEMDKSHSLTKSLNSNTVKSPAFGVKKRPVFLISQAYDIKDMIRNMLSIFDKTEEDMLEALDEMSSSLSIDLRNDVYHNIGKNINIGVYDGQNLGLGEYNTLLAIEVKNEGKAKKVLKSFYKEAKKLLDDAGGASALMSLEKKKIGGAFTIKLSYPMAGSFLLGVGKKHIVFTTNEEMYKNAMKGSYKNGFAKSFKKDPRNLAINKYTSQFFYVDMNEGIAAVKSVYNAINSFASAFSNDDTSDSEKQIEIICNELSHIKYLLAYAQYKDGILASEFRISTDFKTSFVQGITDMVKRLSEELE